MHWIWKNFLSYKAKTIVKQTSCPSSTIAWFKWQKNIKNFVYMFIPFFSSWVDKSQSHYLKQLPSPRDIEFLFWLYFMLLLDAGGQMNNKIFWKSQEKAETNVSHSWPKNKFLWWIFLISFSLYSILIKCSSIYKQDSSYLFFNFIFYNLKESSWYPRVIISVTSQSICFLTKSSALLE